MNFVNPFDLGRFAPVSGNPTAPGAQFQGVPPAQLQQVWGQGDPMAQQPNDQMRRQQMMAQLVRAGGGQ